MLIEQLIHIKFCKENWKFIDFRIDIPAKGKGSDAINLHTQYSNPVAEFTYDGIVSYGAGFTLGKGNDLVCEAAKQIIDMYDGSTLSELAKNKECVYDFLANPDQIRWLSPNAGVQYQAVGLIINAIFDYLSRYNKKPLWQLLTEIKAESLNSFFGSYVNISKMISKNDPIRTQNSDEVLRENVQSLFLNGLPTYHTTWIGTSAEDLLLEINDIVKLKGIKLFKIKIGPNIQAFLDKIDYLQKHLASDIQLAVDANQTLSLQIAQAYLLELNKRNIKWLEEPFAPDNVLLFEELVEFKRSNNIQVEIVTGENCPSPHIAMALMKIGIDRFQADPCRMMGMLDILLICELANRYKVPVTPHAGGSCLDELSAHISFYNQAKFSSNDEFSNSLLENVGFCSKLLKSPAIVKNGKIQAPTHFGLLGDFKDEVKCKFKDYREGITWEKL